MKTIRALIIQSYPVVRAALREMIVKENGMVLLGEFEDGAAGLKAIQKHRPHLLFLGIELRGLDGFDVLKAADGHRPPAVVFVSHFERYAARAFAAHAADYLLQPFTRARFREAIKRARVRLKKISRRDEFDGDESRKTGSPAIVALKVARRLLLLKPDDIEAVVARRAGSTVHAEETFQVRASLVALQSKLRGARFVRINRSTLVNSRHITEIVRKNHGDGLLRTARGREFPLSRRYRAAWSALIPNG